MKRRFRLGPATTFALAGALVVAYVRFPAWQRETEEKRVLEAARAEIRDRPARKAAPVRDLESLWGRRGLSAAQIRALKALRAEEGAQIAPLQRRVDLAVREFETWMRAHQGGASLAEIQARGAAFSAASAPLSAAKERFYQRGLRVFSK